MLFGNYGKYYGVVSVFSPSFVRKTFTDKAQAEAYAEGLGSSYYVIEM